MWNPSICSGKFDKICEIYEYLNNCTCINKYAVDYILRQDPNTQIRITFLYKRCILTLLRRLWKYRN